MALPRSATVPSSLFRTLLDGLIVFDDIKPADGPYAWSPVQLEGGKSAGALAAWLALPWGGPQRVDSARLSYGRRERLAQRRAATATICFWPSAA